MRSFIIATFALTAFFGAPLFANAQVCTSAGTTCTFPTGNTGICTPSGDGFICQSSGGGTVGAPVQPGGGNVSAPVQPGGGNTGSNATLINPLNIGGCAPNGNCLMNFLNSILDVVINVGTVVVILMLVFVGYKFVVAQGSDSKLSEAKQMLLWTIIGALVLLGAKAISEGIQATVRALGS